MAHETILSDLEKITNWANQWKMKFNPDISKQAVEIIFSNKTNKPQHPPVTFGGIPVARVESTTHIALTIDQKLSFREHISCRYRQSEIRPLTYEILIKIC